MVYHIIHWISIGYSHSNPRSPGLGGECIHQLQQHLRLGHCHAGELRPCERRGDAVAPDGAGSSHLAMVDVFSSLNSVVTVDDVDVINGYSI